MKEINLNGYIMVPRALLYAALSEHPEAAGENDAFLRVLLYVNFKESVLWKNGVKHLCARGESLFSYEQWAGVLGWTRSRTRRFFQHLFNEGLAELVPDTIVSHIRLPNYDTWASSGAKLQKEKKVAADNGFLNFWEEFHAKTYQDKRNISKARKEWNKLTPAERIRAVENIDNYYAHIGQRKFCLQAVNYLAYKAFDNEYEF